LRPGRSDKEAAYIEKLTAIDPEIADVYKSVNEIFYGTKENPERASMFQMRQAVDHFFEKLAPDDKVRSSEFFTEKKEPGKENSIYRVERISYAAHTLVKDKDTANLLVANSRGLLENYDRLQRAHKRGPIDDREAVRNVIEAMCAELESWLDALET